ncbi:MAG: GNAT family N-acetyltransferase [Pseudomonadota bacterium]|nr:GNAT family N-acetyltransferase [Pseudomonadota bacterium]
MPAAIQIPPTARLAFRLMDSADAPLLFELDQDPEVMRYLNDSKPSTWEDIQQKFVPRMMAFTDAASGCGLWEVRRRDDGDYLGWILVRQYGIGTSYHDGGILELGWRLKRHCWGQGIATEAASAIIDVLRQQPGIRAFCAIADPANLGSVAVMRKLGMHFVDNRVHRTPWRNFDVAYYEMAR